MSKPLIYLSGMMDGVSVEDGNSWRLIASKFLRDSGFEVYNPYERKQSGSHKYTPNEIVHNDIYYLNKSSVVLVNLDLPETLKNKDIPFFTIGEMFLANEHQKPIIAYTNCLRGRAGYEFTVTKSLTDLEECLDYIVRNYA